MSIFGLFFILMFLVIAIGGTILWIWTIVDCATKEPSEGNDKIIWIIIIVFTNWIGSLIYIFGAFGGVSPGNSIL